MAAIGLAANSTRPSADTEPLINSSSLALTAFNTLRPRQNGRRFADDVFKCIFLNENVWILLKISLKFVPKGPIKNIPSLVQVMAWRRPGDKPLSEPMMVSLLTHICVARPHLPLGKMAAFPQTIYSTAFSRMRSVVLWLKFHWSLFIRVQLTITQHWFRQWLGAVQATRHYLDQCWPRSLPHKWGS